MPNSKSVRRSRVRRVGESAYGVLLLVKSVLMGLVALLLVGAGAWTSWETASPAMTGGERGTVRVAECGDGECWGPFTPSGGTAEPRGKVLVAGAVPGESGEVLDVALRPGTDRAVRTGPAGILYGWVPLGGALLLASLVVAGGLRMRRTAWGLGLAGAALLAGAWALLTF